MLGFCVRHAATDDRAKNRSGNNSQKRDNNKEHVPAHDHIRTSKQSTTDETGTCADHGPSHRRPNHMLIRADRPPHWSSLPLRFIRGNHNLRVAARAGNSLPGQFGGELHGLATVGASGRRRFIQERKVAHLRNCGRAKAEKQLAGGVSCHS